MSNVSVAVSSSQNLGISSGLQYPIGTKSNIAKTSHGFTVGEVLTFKSSAWATYTTGDTALGIVVKVIDANNFTLLTGGFSNLFTGLTANTLYYAQSDASLGTTVTEMPILYAVSATEGFLLVVTSVDSVNYVKALADITDGATPSVDCLNYDQAKVYWETAESSPDLSISNMGEILDISIKKTIAGDSTVTLDGSGLTFVDMDSKALPASSVDIVLSDTVNFDFEISLKRRKSGAGIILVQSK